MKLKLTVLYKILLISIYIFDIYLETTLKPAGNGNNICKKKT